MGNEESSIFIVRKIICVLYVSEGSSLWAGSLLIQLWGSSYGKKNSVQMSVLTQHKRDYMRTRK